MPADKDFEYLRGSAHTQDCQIIDGQEFNRGLSKVIGCEPQAMT